MESSPKYKGSDVMVAALVLLCVGLMAAVLLEAF
jgi:hypothetical protein